MAQTENEKYFYDPLSEKKVKFPSMLSAASVYLTVVVPSYNEQTRRKTKLFAFLILKE